MAWFDQDQPGASCSSKVLRPTAWLTALRYQCSVGAGVSLGTGVGARFVDVGACVGVSVCDLGVDCRRNRFQ